MSLMRNAGFNFIGAAIPSILAVVTIPYVVTALGSGDYGLLTLITSIVGYFALLDINIIASSTKYVAQYNSSGNTHRLNETIFLGIVTYGCIGLIGMTVLFFASDFLVHYLFNIPVNQRGEAITAIRVASIGFAIGQVQSYLQSIPGALMRYDISGRIEAIFGTLLPIITIGLLFLDYGLLQLVWLRVGMSLLQALLMWHMISRLLPSLSWTTPSREIGTKMLSFSAYSFLSKLAALTYSNADKLIIGARVSMSALTYYVIPTTLANRVMSLVFRLSGVMFPHASSLAAQGRLPQLKRDYLLATRYIFFINGAIALTLAIFAEPILMFWLNPEFARAGTAVMAMIACAQWADSVTNLPSLVNDGLGHPKVTGLFALSRAVFGLVLIFLFVWMFGIQGAAGAHLFASVAMSLAFVLYVHNRTVPVTLTVLFREAYQPGLTVLIPVAIIEILISPLALNGWIYLIACMAVTTSLLLIGGLWKVCMPIHRNAFFAQIGLVRIREKL